MPAVARAGGGIGRDAGGERVGRVGEDVDAFGREPGREAGGAAEAAGADGAAGERRVAGAAGEGIGDADAGALREPGGEDAALAGAAKDEDVHAVL